MVDLAPGESITVQMVPITDQDELAAVQWNFRHREAIEHAVLALDRPGIFADSQRRAILSALVEAVRPR